MKTALFDYNLPSALIAQQPAEPRDSSRLLVLQRATGQIEHRHFRDLGDYFHPGDLLVANNSRVIPARLYGRKPTGGAVEIFLLHQQEATGYEWECLVRGKKIEVGLELTLVGQGDRETLPGQAARQGGKGKNAFPLTATVVAVQATGSRILRFSSPITPYLAELGQVPLPPYITSYTGDPERYQTIYSQPEGSVAAPTAGLHFTPELLLALRQQGVLFDTVTLHVGLDTFKPVEAAEVENHTIHSEWAEVTSATAQQINQTSLQGGRIVAVGTTSARTLEWAAQMQNTECGVLNDTPHAPRPTSHPSCPWQRVRAFAGNVNLFITPGYQFRAVDALITNFHLPRSTLLLLVSALIGQTHPGDPDAGRRILLDTYAKAIEVGYRFYSFGDAMLIL
jgi:S-adenosylmethionine:tRNA ribosyltransferase-isomerase